MDPLPSAPPFPGCFEMAPLALPFPSIPELYHLSPHPTCQPWFSWPWPVPSAEIQVGARGRDRSGTVEKGGDLGVLLCGAGVCKQAGWLGWGQNRERVREAQSLAWTFSHHLDTRCRMRVAIWTALNQTPFPGVRHPSLLCLKDSHRGSFISKGEFTPPLAIAPRLN